MQLRVDSTLLALGIATALGVLGSGCASTSSFQWPWQNDSGATANNSNSDGATQNDDTARKRTRRAMYWARRSVSASRRIAHAAGLRAASTSEPKTLASSDGDLRNPGGTWRHTAPDGEASNSKTDSTNSSDGPARTRRLDREAGPGTSDGNGKNSENKHTKTAGSRSGDAKPNRKNGSNDASDSSDTTTASTSTRDFHRPERSKPSKDAGTHGWPVGLPSDVPENGPRALFDPTIDDKKIYRLDDSEDRKDFQAEWDVDAPSADGALAIPGNYAKKLADYDRFDHLDDDQLDRQVAVIVPGKSVTLYAGETEVDTLELPEAGELPEKLRGVRPVRVVRDGTTQLLVHWARSNDDEKTVEYRVAVLKPIGPRIGTIFERTVATRSTPKADLERRGFVEFLRGDDHRFIQWTPADDQGAPRSNDAKVLKWNPWEGVFRVPRPPPTAPDQRS